MKLKPLGRRGLIRGLAVTGVAMASASSLVLTQAPAMADPAVQYLTVGSDTTQDVMNQFTLDLGGNALGSFNAVNPLSTPAQQISGQVITATKTGTGIDGPATTAGNQITANYASPRNCSLTRPNGSGAGTNALLQSMGSANPNHGIAPGWTVTVTGPATNGSTGNDTVTGAIPTGTVASPIPFQSTPQSGCIDISRSSSGPGGNADPNGNVIYLPFGVDAVTDVVGSDGNLAGLIGGPGFSLDQLKAMYTQGQGEVVGTTCFRPVGVGSLACTGTFSTTLNVDLYVPQSGSGTRNFWLQTMYGVSNPPSSSPFWNDHIVAGAPGAGTPVEEHDGASVSAAEDPNGLAPFSIAQYISQSKTGFGHNDRRSTAKLLPMAATLGGTVQQPFTGTLPNAVLNESFPITRQVYNVVEFDRVVDTHPASGPDPFDPFLAGMLVSPSPSQLSQLCQDTFTITNYGFGPLPDTQTAQFNSCGQVVTSLRAFAQNATGSANGAANQF